MNRSLPYALLLLFITTAVMNSQVSFTVPLTFTAGSEHDTLLLGVNPGNTIGIDDLASFGDYRETMAPPTPPPPFPFDTRFVTLPGRVSTYPTGLGSGSFKDIRGYTSTTQVDSFKVRMDGDLTENGDVVVSWPANLGAYATAWTIKPQTGSDWPATDMLAATQVTIPAGSQKNIIIIKTGATATSAEASPIAAMPALDRNYPNPVVASTTIPFTLPTAEHTRLDVYTLLGARVATLVDQALPAGAHSVSFRAQGLPAGVYVYRLQARGFEASRRLFIAR